MSKYRLPIQILLTIVLIFGLTTVLLWKKTYPQMVALNGKFYIIEVADNQKLLEKGLSGHAPLFNDEGMLFVFQKTDKHGFWMKDMTFPIDIIWIDEAHKVVHIEKSVDPSTYPKIFYPDLPAKYVLEVAAGQSNIIKLKIGDSALFLKNTKRIIEI